MTRAAVIDQLEAALYRDGAAQGRVAAAHRAAPRAAERGRADRQRGRARACPTCSAASSSSRRSSTIPGIAKLMVDARLPARHAAGAGLRDDLLRRLPDPRDCVPTSCAHPLQPAAAASMSAMACSGRRTPAAAPRRRRPPVAGRWPASGLAVLAFWVVVGVVRPVRSRRTTRATMVDAGRVRADQRRASARHRLPRPRHARAHPRRRALHRRRRARRRRCSPAASASLLGLLAAVSGGWLDARAEPLARRADLDPEQAVRAWSWSRASAPRSRC